MPADHERHLPQRSRFQLDSIGMSKRDTIVRIGPGASAAVAGPSAAAPYIRSVEPSNSAFGSHLSSNDGQEENEPHTENTLLVCSRKNTHQLRLRCDRQQESGRTGGAVWPPVVAHDDPADQEILKQGPFEPVIDCCIQSSTATATKFSVLSEKPITAHRSFLSISNFRDQSQLTRRY